MSRPSASISALLFVGILASCGGGGDGENSDVLEPQASSFAISGNLVGDGSIESSVADPEFTAMAAVVFPPPTKTCTSGDVLRSRDFAAFNNTWGRGSLTDWTQCIHIGPTIWNVTNAEWSWNWPTRPGGVKAYPAIGYGYKPAHFNTWANPPKRWRELTSAKLNYDIQSAYTGAGNTAFDLWLTTTPTPTSFTNPPTTHEIMIWLETRGGPRPSGDLVETTTLEGVAYDVYFGEPDATRNWKYIAFKRVTSQLGSATLDLKPFLQYAKSRGWVTGIEYLASIELGNEIVFGSGQTTLKNYSVALY